ncbi:MAG: Xaa-Pro peptidase family protein [Rhodobacteraceae bacterium]|nr:Xaa-Pro peptidase family protein [Paracoccaceae bacterium]
MEPQFPDFPKEEFEDRYRRARAMMQAAQLDALLATERLNYQYFSGHRSEQNAVDKIRPYMFILPKDDEPVLITMPFEVAQIEATCHVGKIRTTGALTGHPEFVANVLREAGLSRARIGAELGREQYLGISHAGFSEIVKSLPQAEFVDAADIFLECRVEKSPREIECCRRAARISATAQKEALSLIHAGMTENEVAQVLRERLIAGGAEKISLLCVVSGPVDDRGIVLLPTERRISRGETVGFDVGVSWKGYWSDLARTASVGEPSAELDEFYSWMMELRHDCNMQLREGNSPADVIRVVDRRLKKRNMRTMGVGRIGHGVGLDTTEYPSLAAFERMVFRRGMTFACNPNFANHLGFINAEDNWAVSGKEPDLLSEPVAEARISTVAA